MQLFFKLFLLLLVSSAGYAGPLSNNQKYESLGLLWGLLKYHHPEVSKGKHNWDAEFVAMLAKVEKAGSQEELNSLYKQWILSFGKIPDVKPKMYDTTIFTKNEDYKWFESYGFDAEIMAMLTAIKNAKHKAGGYYVSRSNLNKFINFENEKGYAGFDVSKKTDRLLTLFSFWNAMQYFNVNKYTFDKNWNTVLHEMVPVFADAETNTDYQIAKARLFRYIDDTHFDFYNKEMHSKLYPYVIPAGLLNVNDTLIVYGTGNKTELEYSGLKVGDIIVAIDGKSINTLLQEKIAPYHSCSNVMALKRYSNFLAYNDKEYAKFSLVDKSGEVIEKQVKFYKTIAAGEQEIIKPERPFALPDDIAYLNLQQVDKKYVDSFFVANAGKKGIIIDIRKSPRHFIEDRLAHYLYDEKKVFVKVMGSLGVPGLAEYDLQAPLKVIKDPFKAGSKNKDYYKGKVVVLVDRNTQSRMEYIAMMLQQAPNCKVIGEQTAGVFMNILEYRLPDNDLAIYTGMQAFYPDGQLAFKKGVRLDREIRQSALNYDPDLYKKEAVRVIYE